MLRQQTLEKLSRLKLPAMVESYRRLVEAPDFSTRSPDEFLGLLVDAEWTARNNKRWKRLLQQSGMTQGPCVEDLNYKPSRKLDRNLLTLLAECGWIDHHRNLLITGKTGTGKTFLACALGHNACRFNYPVKYIRLPRLLTDLQIARLDGSYNRYLSQLKKCRLLIIDDWGLAEISAADSRDILEVIDDRVNRGSTILAAQIPVADWYSLFIDPTLADACMDRLVHNSYRLELEGDSLRRDPPVTEQVSSSSPKT
jgi:DNA replication protein DnaC